MKHLAARKDRVMKNGKWSFKFRDISKTPCADFTVEKTRKLKSVNIRVPKKWGKRILKQLEFYLKTVEQLNIEKGVK